MDFNFTEEQTMLGNLAREILEQEVTQELLKQVESSEEGLSRAIWSKLAEANLLGLAVPEGLGGMGFGVLEICALLVEVGRAVAPVPAFASLVLGGLPVAKFGSEEQKRRWLTPLAAGRAFLSGACVDAGSNDASLPTAVIENGLSVSAIARNPGCPSTTLFGPRSLTQWEATAPLPPFAMKKMDLSSRPTRSTMSTNFATAAASMLWTTLAK